MPRSKSFALFVFFEVKFENFLYTHIDTVADHVLYHNSMPGGFDQQQPSS